VIALIIDVSDVRKNKGNSERFQGSFPDFQIDMADQGANFYNLQVNCEATNTGEGIYVEGEITGKLDLSCSLCLNRYTVDLKAPFSENFYREGESLPEDLEEPVQIYHGDEIDLSDTIKENLVLSLPMKPLCRPDCRGLCPHCGCDLNIEQCDCKDEQLDPRLAVLGDLLKGFELENK